MFFKLYFPKIKMFKPYFTRIFGA